MTLGDAKVGTTVVVTKNRRRQCLQTPYYGYGNNKRK